ncbi:MAG: hypothetical protein V1794_15235 [Candidatus Glassbacteria bacterium]
MPLNIKIIISVSFLAGLLLLACDAEHFVYSPPDTSEAQLRLAGLNECTGSGEGTALATDERNDRLLAIVENGLVKLEHSRASFNCCMDSVSLAQQIEGGLIRVIETEHSHEPCRCVCEFTVQAEIIGLGSGQYVLEVCSAAAPDEKLCSVQFTITEKKGD